MYTVIYTIINPLIVKVFKLIVVFAYKQFYNDSPFF